jgi:hypothetical protein
VIINLRAIGRRKKAKMFCKFFNDNFSVDEINKIKKVLDNKSFQTNSVEAIKAHIKNNLLIKERQAKANENFKKNFDILNFKK